MQTETKRMWVSAICVFALLQAALIVCKLFNVIAGSWWAVFAPTLGVLGIFVTIVIFGIVLLIIASQYERED